MRHNTCWVKPAAPLPCDQVCPPPPPKPLFGSPLLPQGGPAFFLPSPTQLNGCPLPEREAVLWGGGGGTRRDKPETVPHITKCQGASQPSTSAQFLAAQPKAINKSYLVTSCWKQSLRWELPPRLSHTVKP